MMRDGSTQELLARRRARTTCTFDEYVYDLSALTPTGSELIHYKPSDRFLHELFFPDLQPGLGAARTARSLLAEGHSRLASPLYNIAFMAMALAAVLGGGFSRLGYGRPHRRRCRPARSLTRILGFGVQAVCEKNAWLNVLQYAVPLGAIGLGRLRQLFSRPARSSTSQGAAAQPRRSSPRAA